MCLHFSLQGEDDDEEPMDRDDEPQMAIVLHEVVMNFSCSSDLKMMILITMNSAQLCFNICICIHIHVL